MGKPHPWVLHLDPPYFTSLITPYDLHGRTSYET